MNTGLEKIKTTQYNNKLLYRLHQELKLNNEYDKWFSYL